MLISSVGVTSSLPRTRGTVVGMADSRDAGLFGPDSVTWRVHAEPVLMVAGLRSLFLQSLHPRAVAGVVQNSGYKQILGAVYCVPLTMSPQ